MRHHALLAAGIGLAALSALPAVAQPAPPALAYVQPVPALTVQAVQDKLAHTVVVDLRAPRAS